MLNSFVLIITICLQDGSCAVASVDGFRSIEACRAALVEAQEAHQSPYRVEGSCSSKGVA